MNESSRRQFLRGSARTAAGLAIGASVMDILACGGGTTDPTTPAVEIDQPVTYKNSDGTILYEEKRRVTAGTRAQIRISSLPFQIWQWLFYF